MSGHDQRLGTLAQLPIKRIMMDVVVVDVLAKACCYLDHGKENSEALCR